MTTVADLSEFLNRHAPLSLAESWDNVGLLVGSPQRHVERVLTCLTVTPDVAAEAIEKRVQLIVTHHPVLFKSVQKIVSTDLQGDMLLRLIEAGVALYSPHTAFDSAREGINQQLSELFGLSEIRPLRQKIISRAVASAGSTEETSNIEGAGRHGLLSQRNTLAQLCDSTKQLLNISSLQFVGNPNQFVSKLAIACGAAAEFIPDAIQAGCEALLVGEARFHDCLRARDSGLALILPGHYATERPAVEVLAKRLQSEFPKLHVSASNVERDPVLFG